MVSNRIRFGLFGLLGGLLVLNAVGAAFPSAPGRFARCKVLSYSEEKVTPAVRGAQPVTTGTVPSAASFPSAATDAVKMQTWIVQSSSETNVTYAVRETLLASGEIELCSYTPNRVLATLEQGKSETAFRAALAAKGLTVKYELMKDSDGNSVFVVEAEDTASDVAETMTASIQSTGFCNGKIYKDTVFSVCTTTPNDPYWSDQWNLTKIGASEAWDATHDAADVVVAVLDTGINYYHMDLNENLWTNPAEFDKGSNGVDDDGNGIVDDFYGVRCVGGNLSGNPMDDVSHGSHCAGIIGSVGNNGVGVAGIAWNVKLMALKFCDADGNGSSVDAIRCLGYAEVHNVKVVNCSWIVKGDWNIPLSEKIEVMGRKGTIFVCAAGNANKGEEAVDLDTEGPPTYPACYTHSNVVTVAATDADDELANFSFCGERSVDIAAPGVDVYSTVLGSTAIDKKSGTSMAAPHVAGALALLMAYYPEQNSYELVQKLYDCGEPLDSLKGKVKTGKRLSLKGLFGLRAPSGAEATATLGTMAEAVALYWNAVVGAGYYRVWRAASAVGEKTLLRDWHVGLTYTDTTAQPGVHYFYFLQAAASEAGASASPCSSAIEGWRGESPTSVKVTFDAAGGTVSTASADFEMGGTYGDLPVPTYAGNVFLGWYTAATSGTQINSNCAVRAEVTSFHAHWIADGEPRLENLFARQRYPWNGYVDVSFGLAGVDANYAADVTLSAKPGNGGTPFPLRTWIGSGPTNLSNGAHAFVWNSGVDAPGGLFTNLTLAATLAVKARSVTISFNGNGGTPSEGSRKYTPNVAYGSLPTATRAGYTFAGWYTAASSGTPVTTSSTVPSAATTLYAHWTAITPPAPTNVSATDGTYSDKVVVTWSAVSGASTYYVSRNTSNSSSGATQLGSTASTSYTDTTATVGMTYYYWVKAYRSDNGLSSAFSASDSGYRKKIPVSLVISGADSVRAGGSCTYTATVTYNDDTTATVTPTWSLSEGSSYGSVTAAGVFTANGTATQRTVKIAACYAENGVTVTAALKTVTITTFSVTITFDGNGGTASASSQSYMAYGTYGSLPTATQSGYTFAGWYTASSGGTPVTTSSTVPSAATTLYAHWTEIPQVGLPAALDCADLDVTNDPTAPWTVVTTGAYQGGSCVKSGDISDGETSTLQTTVTGPGTFSFRWKASSEEAYDTLTLFVDGGAVDSISGTTDWTECSLTLDAGAHAIEWVYEKDASGFDGEDCAWIDAVVVPMPVPSGVSAGDGAATASVKITWSTVAGATSYIVYRGTTSDASAATQIGTATSATYTDKTGTPGVKYWYFVVATDGTRTSVLSSGDSGYRALTAPTDVVAGDAKLTSGVVVSWTAIEGASSYQVYRGTTTSSSSAALVATVSGTGCLDVTAVAGTTYYYFVKAVSASGVTSAFSAYDKGSRKSGTVAPYLVIDLSSTGGGVSELSSVPSGGWTDEYKTTKLVLRRIPAGSFTMGSPSSEVGRYSEEYQHTVTLTKPFYMGVFEVTQKQYSLVTGTNPSAYTGDKRPVENVSYNALRGTSEGANWPASDGVDATSFIGKIRAKTGLDLDLPTEAQWEYACRAGTTTALNSGCNLTNTTSDAHIDEVGCYSYNCTVNKGGYTSGHKNVGSYAPNAWGLYDMHGNVWEWCLDWYASSLGTSAVTDPVGATSGSSRLLRGGSWSGHARYCRSAYRYYILPSGGSLIGGFRLSLRDISVSADSVAVSFDANGGATAVSSQVYAKGSSYSSLPAATREGYTLVGWYTAASGGTQVTHETIVSASIQKLYAQWKACAYLVIDLSGGTNATNYAVSSLSAVPSGGWTDEYKTTKLVLRRIPAGSFTMGSPSSEVGRFSNEDQHSVTLTKPFYMGVFEVTQKQYSLVTGTNPSSYTGDKRPVECVSYNVIRGSSSGAGWPSSSAVDATSFLGKIRAKTGLDLDLPTEAQWEYACRAGTTTALNSGCNLTNATSDAHLDEVGCYYYNRTANKGGYTSGHKNVGSYLPNAWGLYDMHGNVWEWCLDWYASSLGTSAVTDPVGAGSGLNRVRRGGSWINYARCCRSAFRYDGGPSDCGSFIGFRLVRTLSE